MAFIESLSAIGDFECQKGINTKNSNEGCKEKGGVMRKNKKGGDTMRAIKLFMVIVLSSLMMSAVASAQANQPPIADAGLDQNIYTGDTTYVNGSATDPEGDAIIIWSWTVADAPAGSSYSLEYVDRPTTYFYAATAGDYVLSLVVVSAAANFSMPDTVTIHVADNLPPVAVATADVTSGVAPLTVCFDGSGSYDPEGGALIYDWNLGDAGATASTPTVCHTYNAPGEYTVGFAVVDVRNAADTEILVIAALEPTNQAPVASPTATPNTGSAPLFVQFAANAADADGDTLSYAWSFGDGGTSTEESPAHTYATPGTFVAWLTVSDGVDTVSASMTITASPSVELNVTRAEIHFKGRKSSLASVEIQAELAASVPAADDVVALHLDGAEVFAVPFSEFAQVYHHGAVVPGVYKLKTRHLWVKIDFEDGWLAVDADKVALPGYNASNGVDVEVMLGDAVAVDNIQPVDSHADRHYKHYRPARHEHHCSY